MIEKTASWWLSGSGVLLGTSPVADAVQRLEDLMLVVDLAHAAFFLVEQDALVWREALVEVGADV